MTRPRSLCLTGLLCAALSLITASNALAQRPTFTPYHTNGIYDVNEKVGWTVALPQGAAAPTAPFTYTIKKDNSGDPIKTGTLVGVGFIDTTAPPVGIWAAFNQIRGPKEMAPMVDSPHNNLATPQQQLPFTKRCTQWLNSAVKGEAGGT